jgi:hypothetical protein
MSQTLSLPNYDSLNIIEKTQLTNSVAASVNSLPVADSNDFAANVPVLIGQSGS